MVEPDRIRTYAQVLQRHPVFRQLVLWYVASRIRDAILNSDEADSALLAEVTNINQRQIARLEKYLMVYWKQLEFWDFCATEILARIEAWTVSGERPANIGSGGLATGFRDPALSNLEADKEAEVRDRFAADAAAWLIERLGLLKVEETQLAELLGLKAEAIPVKESHSKLSQLQKKILLKLMDTARGPYKPVPWKPAEWFGEQTRSDHAAISRALKKMEARGLVVRRAAGREGLSKRTALLELTAFGYQSIKLLTRTKNI